MDYTDLRLVIDILRPRMGNIEVGAERFSALDGDNSASGRLADWLDAHPKQASALSSAPECQLVPSPSSKGSECCLAGTATNERKEVYSAGLSLSIGVRVPSLITVVGPYAPRSDGMARICGVVAGHFLTTQGTGLVLVGIAVDPRQPHGSSSGSAAPGATSRPGVAL